MEPGQLADLTGCCSAVRSLPRQRLSPAPTFCRTNKLTFRVYHPTRIVRSPPSVMERASSPYGNSLQQQQQQQHHPGSDEAGSPDPATGQKRKRIRASRACEMCRSRKVKCNEQNPCSNCIRMSLWWLLCNKFRTTNTLPLCWRSSCRSGVQTFTLLRG